MHAFLPNVLNCADLAGGGVPRKGCDGGSGRGGGGGGGVGGRGVGGHDGQTAEGAAKRQRCAHCCRRRDRRRRELQVAGRPRSRPRCFS